MTRWIEKVHLGDVFHDEETPFQERRDEIVRRIKRTAWFARHDSQQTELVELLDELADAHDVDEFDAVWGYVYDVADSDRVWIETFRRRAEAPL